MDEKQDTMTARERLVADLRQRAVWREQSAAEYGRQGRPHAADYFTGQADGFRSAAFIVEQYHPEALAEAQPVVQVVQVDEETRSCERCGGSIFFGLAEWHHEERGVCHLATPSERVV